MAIAPEGEEVPQMTCEEAERLVTPYINDELTNQELCGFLEHIDTCENCREELEIYFMVDVGIRQLDCESGTYDITGELERKLASSCDRIKNAHLFQIFRYCVDTLGVIGLIVTILLQCRIWWQFGIF